jgi:AAA family ATP:ADP antiporter
MGGLVSVVLPLALVWTALAVWLGQAQARGASQWSNRSSRKGPKGMHDKSSLPIADKYANLKDAILVENAGPPSQKPVSSSQALH